MKTETNETTAATMADIERLAATAAKARDVLTERVTALEAAMQDEKRRKLPGIRKAVHEAAEATNRLHAAVAANPSLFEKPKSQIFHGLKCGWRKLKGGLGIVNAENTVALIEKHFDTEHAAMLIKVTKAPIKKAMEQLSASELKRVGVTITADTDEAFVAPVDSGVDKLVDALLKDATLDGSTEAAG